MIQGPLHDPENHRRLDGLLDEIVGPVPHGFDRVLHRSIGGHQDDIDVGPSKSGRAEKAPAIQARHHQVDQSDLNGRLP